MARTKKIRPDWNGEIVYVFKNVHVECYLNPDLYDEDDKRSADQLLAALTEEIRIDKTYVNFEGTKYKKTFLFEKGWNELRDLIVETDFGRFCSKYDRNAINETCKIMIPGYLELVFADFGWDVDNILFEIPNDYDINVEFEKDTYNEWKRYPGEWQTWS